MTVYGVIMATDNAVSFVISKLSKTNYFTIGQVSCTCHGQSTVNIVESLSAVKMLHIPSMRLPTEGRCTFAENGSKSSFIETIPKQLR